MSATRTLALAHTLAKLAIVQARMAKLKALATQQQSSPVADTVGAGESQA